MEQKQELLGRINQTGKRLSKGQKRIAEYILENYDKAAFMTASRLGEKVGVSESTVVRFAIALGYDGYPALQKALQEMIRTRLTAVQRIELATDQQEGQVVRSALRADIANIRTTLEELDELVFQKAVDSLCDARRIYICGLRASEPLAELLAYYMNFIFDNVYRVQSGASDVLEQLVRVQAGDVLFAISFPRYSNRTLQTAEYAKSRGATLIALTDTMFSPVAEIADLTLTARSDMAAFVDSMVAPMSLLNALIVALGNRNREQLRGNFALLESLWDQTNVYVGKGPI